MPSKDELDIAFNRLAQNRVAGNDTPVGGFNKGYYWTSTDYNNSTAWTQYFMDGQQFDRVQTLDGTRNPPNPFRVRPIRAFGTNNVLLACKDGGLCKIGDTEPLGLTVFYVAPDLLIANGTEWRYLSVFLFQSQWKLSFEPFCDSRKPVPTRRGLGEGIRNSRLLISLCKLGFESNLRKDSFHTPSIDELRLALAFLGSPVGSYWSSTSSGATSALAMVCDGKSCTEVVKDRDMKLNWVIIRAFK